MLRFSVTYQLTSQTPKAVIKQMKSVFSEYTPPESLITDNGSCYTSEEFKECIKDYNIEPVTSSPNYNEGNRFAEKYVNIIMSWLQKAKDAKEDPYKSMIIYQTTPLNNMPSPLELFNKCTCTDLPISNLRR